MRHLGIAAGLILLMTGIPVFAQSPAQADHLNDGLYKLKQALDWTQQPKVSVISPFQSRSGPVAALQTGLSGTWWRDPDWVKTLGLTADQQKKMDDSFQQYRLKLIDLNAALEKEELILEPLVENVRPSDEAKIQAQIDRVAEARAELEKANARMLLGIRQVLTQDQWNKLPSNSKNTKFRIYKKSL